ncbi:MAG: hypothetical protein QM755_02150 [Luteolibacter sp.]
METPPTLVRTRPRVPWITLAVTLGFFAVWFTACKMGMLARGEAALREHEVRISGTPRFSSSGPDGCPEAWIEGDTRGRHFHWPQADLPAGELPAGQAFTFTFLEPAFFSTQGGMALWKISTGDKVLYDASMCRIHREAMHRTVVTVDASSVNPAEKNLFPNCGRIGKCGSKEVTTWVCDSCLRERDRWLDRTRLSTASAAR